MSTWWQTPSKKYIFRIYFQYITSSKYLNIQQINLLIISFEFIILKIITFAFRKKIYINIKPKRNNIWLLFYRKTDNKQDECLVAQEKLHPVCAQRIEGSAVPTCHSLAEYCRLESECRSVQPIFTFIWNRCKKFDRVIIVCHLFIFLGFRKNVTRNYISLAKIPVKIGTNNF